MSLRVPRPVLGSAATKTNKRRPRTSGSCRRTGIEGEAWEWQEAAGPLGQCLPSVRFRAELSSSELMKISMYLNDSELLMVGHFSL